MKCQLPKSKILYDYNIFKKALLLILCLGFQFSNAQDNCANAIPVTAGSYTIEQVNGSITGACGGSNANMAEWYAYTPTENHSVTVTSDLPENICKDTNFSVFIGSCAGLNCYVHDDDSGVLTCNSGNNFSYLSKKTFDVVAGTTYYIAWDNKYSTAGFTFQIIEAPFVPSPCYTAIPVTAGITQIAAIDGTNVTTVCSNTNMAKWYTYTPALNYRITISSDLQQNICKDTRFSVYTGSCSGNGLTCVANDDNSGIIACNSGNTNSNLSKKTFDVYAGTTYYIVWDNRWSAAGFDFELTEQIIVIPVQYTAQSVATVNSQFNLCVADMNGDGKDDIAGVSPNNLRIHYQGAGGTFTYNDFPISGSSLMPDWSLAAGDYNRDGYTDLLLGNYDGATFLKSNSDGTAYSSITPGQYIFCQRTNFVDINNDGNLDAFSCHDVKPNVYYINDDQGNGDFTYYQSGTTPGAYMLGVTPTGGNYASLWTDLDNDGDSDLFISKCSGPACEIHRNDGNGVFTDISAQAGINVLPVQSWSSAIADFDNDGDMDILIGSNGSVKSMLFRNNLDTTNNVEEAYTNISAGSGWDSDSTMNRDYIAYDFDNDGFVDVMGGGNKIMFNKGDGFFEAVNYPSISVGAVGDLNNDGFLDILNGSTIRYAIPNNNNWMKITLKGIESNVNGIGARIQITGPFGKKIRDVRSGEGFEFMSTINTHFGLGTADSVSKMVITWPSGIVDTIINPGINQAITVTESSTLGIDDKLNNAFTLYPNPSSDYLNFTFKSNESQIVSAEIFDLTGKKIAAPAIKNKSVNIQSLPTGAYIILLKNDLGKPFSKRFLKK